MKKHFIIILFSALLILPRLILSQSTLNCAQCHSEKATLWTGSHHADTQNDVAEELAGEWAGLPADSVINGSEAENCIACHGATAVAANGGMSEVDALNYFFTTSNGVFTSSTVAQHTDEWPHVACVTCHNVPSDHPVSMPTMAIYNSSDAQYHAISNVSKLCGQCHGSLRFKDTDHLRYDAWLMSRHGNGGQADVAAEIAEEWAGSTPAEVVSEENCIACHAPTATLEDGGITEAQALEKFFTTTDGKFTSGTTGQNNAAWPEVACIACHNPHKPSDYSLFNSSSRKYDTFTSSQELCGQCHGNLKFPDTDHLSYNIEKGTGGMGVADKVTMPGVKCVDCHMIEGEEETLASMYAGHSWSVFVKEEDGSEEVACTKCHPSRTPDVARAKIEELQNEFATLDSIANEKVAAAEEKLAGSSDENLLAKLNEAKFNLAYAEGDESGGVHNHAYTKALFNDAIAKADEILTGVEENSNNKPTEFRLYQNYPNPFNPSTIIKFSVPEKCNVTLSIYDELGRKISTLVNGIRQRGIYKVEFNASHYSTGVFIVKLTAGTFLSVKKMLLLR